MKVHEDRLEIALRVIVFPKLSETFILGHARVISELGFNLRVFANKKNSSFNSGYLSSEEKYLLSRTVEIENSWDNTYLKRLKLVVKYVYNDFNLKYLRLLNPLKYGFKSIFGGALLDAYDLSELSKYPIVHIQFGYAMTSIDKMKLEGLIASKLVVTFHGSDAHYTAKNKNEKIEQYRLLFEVGDYFTCNTEYLKKQLLALGCSEEKLEVVHVPVDTEVFKPRIDCPRDDSRISLLTVGRLVKWKGHSNGIKVVDLLVKRGYDVVYKIVGEGAELANLKEMVASLQLEKNVEFIGRQSHNAVLDYMQSCDVFLMTSTQDTSGRMETQGVVTIEAQACGKPVIGFACGGVPYTILDNRTGFLCEQDNIIEMTDCVETLINNPALREEMGSEAIEFVKNNFSEKVAKQKWRSIYEMLLANDEVNVE